MVKLTEYCLVNKGTELEDFDEKITRIKKSDLAGATIEAYNPSPMTELLVPLKDGRKIHILPDVDGENFDFCLWADEQTPAEKGAV